ncbi:hypothetical protein B484DRAFT_456864 [Ochromonadaceae sp. CCMP2298]|nr:hypothetical protein B484DRAFT_456864 [Ochromonadaceae sp. CCMP2298]|mmetsp:Transcript_21473/g.47743  ORF Transcript_21473/g.47743 Transcript_21473/m.47743 type:complete len:244 (-) Transcript_21473:56-787(-)
MGLLAFNPPCAEPCFLSLFFKFPPLAPLACALVSSPSGDNKKCNTALHSTENTLSFMAWKALSAPQGNKKRAFSGEYSWQTDWACLAASALCMILGPATQSCLFRIRKACAEGRWPAFAAKKEPICWTVSSTAVPLSVRYRSPSWNRTRCASTIGTLNSHARGPLQRLRKSAVGAVCPCPCPWPRPWARQAARTGPKTVTRARPSGFSSSTEEADEAEAEAKYHTQKRSIIPPHFEKLVGEQP